MGTDNLFHKRKARQARDLVSRKARQDPYDKVLIVCEGEKTEPHYFNGLRDHYGINGANVEICGECGSDPLSIFQHARQRYREEKDTGDPFDRVFCEFDKDTHSTYKPGLDQIAHATPKGTFVAINSVPCFEYWLLLHFKCTTKPYETLPGISACNQVLNDLKAYIPHYAKGMKDTIPEFIGQLDFAKRNAMYALQEAEANHTDNPGTRVHELVNFLQHIKD